MRFIDIFYIQKNGQSYNLAIILCKLEYSHFRVILLNF